MAKRSKSKINKHKTQTIAILFLSEKNILDEIV